MNAKSLRDVADIKNNNESDTRVSKVVKKIYAKAEKAAQDGLYQTNFYDDADKLYDISDQIISSLKKHGFKISFKEDHAYSEHVGKKIMYFEIKW